MILGMVVGKGLERALLGFEAYLHTIQPVKSGGKAMGSERLLASCPEGRRVHL